MIVQLRIPPVARAVSCQPRRCAYPECEGHLFRFHQGDCPKPLVDTTQSQVEAMRFRCLTCGRSFRVYPQGVGRDQQSQAVKQLSVLLYGLGLSSRMISRFLEGLDCFVSKSTIFRNVQATSPQIKELRSNEFAARCRWPQLSPNGCAAAARSPTCLSVTVALDHARGTVVSIKIPEGQETASVLEWILGLARAAGVEVSLRTLRGTCPVEMESVP